MWLGHKVRHRIDGLEIILPKRQKMRYVRHRIDGLETTLSTTCPLDFVRHRIDGLENHQKRELAA